MLKFSSLVLLFLGFVLTAQTQNEELDQIVESEMKAAATVQNFQVNPNTQDYDITYHQLDLTVDPAVYFISGTIITTFTALSDMSTITFDLTDDLTVSSVMMNGSSLSFSQLSSEELVIDFPSTVTSGSSQTVTISYSGTPATNGFGSFTIDTHSGVPVLWTLSEPFGARDWWPCKQDLNDKINMIDVYLTAPNGYQAVSNGMEQSAVDNGNGTKTTHFHHSYPIPAYLIAIAVTNYQIYTQTAGTTTTFPIVNYFYPEDYTSAQVSCGVTPSIINLFENLFEPYPFNNEKYGHAQFGWGGGMEHTTVSFMGGWTRGLIAHELAHQWFGDKITCGTWKDIWLNEGFAEYLSGLVVENFDGNATFISWRNSKINNITSQPGGAVYLTDTQAENINRIFNGRLTYNKGSMLVHMLRWKMGDTAFFQGVKNYLADTNLAYGYAVTNDLVPHLETAYGASLTEFFNDWLYGQGFPSYTVNVQNTAANEATITVNQTQSDASVSYFEMPLEIRLYNSLGDSYDVVVENTFDGQQFTITVPFVVVNAAVDPNKHIISANNAVTLSNVSFDRESLVSLYPNPAEENLMISLSKQVQLQNISIYNNLGQLVLTTNESSFSVVELPSGIYSVIVTTDYGSIHKNFIKK